jgi:hypothetical protein
LLDESAAYLDTAHGTFCCSACVRTDRPLAALASGVLRHLTTLKQLSLADCRPHQLGAVARDAAQLTGQLLALHLPRPLRSLKLIEQLS